MHGLRILKADNKWRSNVFPGVARVASRRPVIVKAHLELEQSAAAASTWVSACY